MTWTARMIIAVCEFERTDAERYIRAMKYLTRRQERIGLQPDRNSMYWLGYELGYRREKAILESVFGS